MTPSRPSTPPAPDSPSRTPGEPEWFWVDLPGLRRAYLEEGFTELRRTGAGGPRVVLMTRTVDGAAQEAIVPLTVEASGAGNARTALLALETFTGRVRADLGALTARESELWRTSVELRATLATLAQLATEACAEADGSGCGRCETCAVVARLEQTLPGARQPA